MAKLKTAGYVAWRAGTWLVLNLGVQACPILYLWLHRAEANGFWDYVNCTLTLLIAFGMFVAAVSDIITERAPAGLIGWVGLTGCILGAIGLLHRAIRDEFVLKRPADDELFGMAVVYAIGLMLGGALLKSKIWYDQKASEARDRRT